MLYRECSSNASPFFPTESIFLVTNENSLHFTLSPLILFDLNFFFLSPFFFTYLKTGLPISSLLLFPSFRYFEFSAEAVLSPLAFLCIEFGLKFFSYSPISLSAFARDRGIEAGPTSFTSPFLREGNYGASTFLSCFSSKKNGALRYFYFFLTAPYVREQLVVTGTAALLQAVLVESLSARLPSRHVHFLPPVFLLEYPALPTFKRPNPASPWLPVNIPRVSYDVFNCHSMSLLFPLYSVPIKGHAPPLTFGLLSLIHTSLLPLSPLCYFPVGQTSLMHVSPLSYSSALAQFFSPLLASDTPFLFLPHLLARSP